MGIASRGAGGVPACARAGTRAPRAVRRQPAVLLPGTPHVLHRRASAHIPRCVFATSVTADDAHAVSRRAVVKSSSLSMYQSTR